MEKHTMYIERCVDGYRGQQRVDYYLVFEVDMRIAELERDLAMANDAAAKGEQARMEAAGMQLTIWELQNALRRSPCPRPVGDDRTVDHCVKNGRCGCENKQALGL